MPPFHPSPAHPPAQVPKGATFKKINWLKAGILACDKLLTVSPNYATEIASGPQLGVELDNVVKAKGVEGIVNGMDVEDWSPALVGSGWVVGGWVGNAGPHQQHRAGSGARGSTWLALVHLPHRVVTQLTFT